MATLDERINKELLKLEQLKRQKRAQDQRGKQRERAAETRRKIIAGAILLDVFPKYNQLTPKRTNEENSAEFAPLANFLIALAEDKEIVARLETAAEAKTEAAKPPEHQGEALT